MKRRAFSQIMAIITVSVLVLLAIIVMVIAFYIQKTNMLVEYSSKQVVYTISLSQHVDSALEAFFKYNTFKEVDKVNNDLALNDKRMMKSPEGEYYYLYYQPIYSDYLSNDEESNPNMDVRWLWIHYYMTDTKRVFPYIQTYVEDMKVPKYVKNQTFKYEEEIPFLNLNTPAPASSNSTRFQLVPEFFVDDNLLFTTTQKGFKVITSNYTVEVVSKATIGKSENGGSDVFFDKGGTHPFLITRDVHAGEFLMDFRVIQMYNALLFKHIQYQEALNWWSNNFAYVYIIPNDHESSDQIHLYSQLINKIPREYGEWYPVELGAIAKYTETNSKTVTSYMVGKYGAPQYTGTRYTGVPNFEWFVYNIVFTPPYSIHSNVDYSNIKMRQYIPFTLYTPITNQDDQLYVGNTQWLFLSKDFINSFLESTNNDNFGVDALYTLTDAMAHVKEEVFKTGKAPKIIVTDYSGNKVMEFNPSAWSGETVYIKVKSGDSIKKYQGIILKNLQSISYTGIAWLTVVESTWDLYSYLEFGTDSLDDKYESQFTLYNVLFNTYMLGHNPDVIKYIDDQNSFNTYSKYSLYKLSNKLYVDHRAIPYTTQILMAPDQCQGNILYQMFGTTTPQKVPNLLSYKDSIDFFNANILKRELYENPNFHWSYVRWFIESLQPPRSAFTTKYTTTRGDLTFYYIRDGVIYPITPVTAVYNNPSVDFPDSIQLWWLPATDTINKNNLEPTTDRFGWGNALIMGNTEVKITESQSVELKDLIGGSLHNLPESVVKTMYSNISVSRPVITDIQYKVDNVKIHYYYAPHKIEADVDRVSFSQELKHSYDCDVSDTCCVNWEFNETTNQTECVEWGDYYSTDTYGSHSKNSYIEYQFSIFSCTKDRYNLHIFKDFDTGYQTILGLGFPNDVDYWKKVFASDKSNKKYFTPYFFIGSWTSHPGDCGCEDDTGYFKYGVDYKKVMLHREEVYYVIEVAEIDMKLRITYDLYATDLRFINNYLGLWKQGNKNLPYYNVMYVMDKDGVTHLSIVGDTVSILSLDGSGYPSYDTAFRNYMQSRYIDPNFLIGKNLYVKSKFMVEVPVKIYIITRYWYGTPGRLNVPPMRNYLTSRMFTEPTSLSRDSFDITGYISDIDNYKQEALRLLPSYYFNPSIIQVYGLPFMVAPDGTINNQPFGVPPEVQVTFTAYTEGFTPKIFD